MLNAKGDDYKLVAPYKRFKSPSSIKVYANRKSALTYYAKSLHACTVLLTCQPNLLWS